MANTDHGFSLHGYVQRLADNCHIAQKVANRYGCHAKTDTRAVSTFNRRWWLYAAADVAHSMSLKRHLCRPIYRLRRMFSSHCVRRVPLWRF